MKAFWLKITSTALLLLAVAGFVKFQPGYGRADDTFIAYDLYNSGSQNLTSFSMMPDFDPPASRNVWGVFARPDTDVPDFLDNTLTEADPNGGMIVSTDNDTFFGIQDLTLAGQGAFTGTGVVSWTFDVSSVSASQVNLAIDAAAVGDWAAGDDFGRYRWEYNVDGGPWQTTSISTTTEIGITQSYTFEDGTSITLDNPLAIQGKLLSNEFQTFGHTVDLNGGTELGLRLIAANNGDWEVFGFRNIIISVPYTGSDRTYFLPLLARKS